MKQKQVLLKTRCEKADKYQQEELQSFIQQDNILLTIVCDFSKWLLLFLAQNITHFEYENTLLSYDACKVTALLETVGLFTNLRVLSLPDCINATVNETIATEFNACLKSLTFLQRLNLSYCNVKNTLSRVLTGLRQRSLVYLNLKDCRLAEHDMFFLAKWKLLSGLRELNLSCNDLQHLDQVVVAMLERMPHITCFSISFCSLAIESQVRHYPIIIFSKFDE